MTKEYNKEGIYLVRLCIDGLWKIILVDDYFPSDGMGNLAFSKPEGKQLWVPLIEKALAKAHSSYYALKAGYVDEGLMFLTGSPCRNIQLEDRMSAQALDKVWMKLESSHQTGYVIAASCGKHSTAAEATRLGLNTHHAYSVLEVKHADNKRFVHIRDPWGQPTKWKGAWHRNDPRWTPKLIALIPQHGSSDGQFWMSFDDFARYFTSLTISQYRNSWKEIRLEGSFYNNAYHKGWRMWKLEISGRTKVHLTLHQQGHRYKILTEVGWALLFKHHRAELKVIFNERVTEHSH